MSSASTTTVALILAVLALAACGDDEEGTAGAQAAGCEEVAAPDPKQVELSPPGDRLDGPATALVETSCGEFTIELDTTRAPRTTASFAHMVQEGLYDGTSIHRIEPGFVVQGGDPLGDGTGGPGYQVQEPPPAGISYTEGVVAMAKTAAEPPGSSGSQFFIVTAADAALGPDYALLGRVADGFDVVERIESLGSPGGEPREPVTIERITLERS